PYRLNDEKSTHLSLIENVDSCYLQQLITTLWILCFGKKLNTFLSIKDKYLFQYGLKSVNNF
ncbi:hypothetical protein, partial [Acinetobacter bereziniae]|uniref:hypothetical protein n=1 Tax=Acinetobacter bereziniae TaxID=106648 RepID=UPI001C2DF520